MEPLPPFIPLSRSVSGEGAPQADSQAQPQPPRVDPTVVPVEAIALDGLAYEAQSQPPRTGGDSSPSDSMSPISSRDVGAVVDRSSLPSAKPPNAFVLSSRPATPTVSVGPYPGGYVSPRSRVETWSGDRASDSRGSSVKRAVAQGRPDFNATLNDDDQRASLGNSMAKEFSEEHLNFMTACFNFQTLSRDGLLKHSAHKHKYLGQILQRFVGDQAAGQINISAQTQYGLLTEWRDLDIAATNRAECDYTLFYVLIDNAVDEITRLVGNDSYKRHLLQFPPEPPQARKSSFSDRISAGAARLSDKAKKKISPNNPPPKESHGRWVPPFATQQMKEWAAPILARRLQELRAPGPDEEVKGAPPRRDLREEIRTLIEELHLDSHVQTEAHALSSPVRAATHSPEPGSASSSASTGAAVLSPREIKGTFDSLMYHCESFVGACTRNESRGIQRAWARALKKDFLVPQPQFTCPVLANDRILEVLNEWLDDKAPDETAIVRIVNTIAETAEPLDA
jgi:hypothetical protein